MDESIVNQIESNLQTAINLFQKFKIAQQAYEEETVLKTSDIDNENENENENHIIIKQSDVEKLKFENQRLRARCELLESGNDVDVTRRIDDAVDQAHQLDVLTQRVAEFKHREEKIIETLGKKALELRKSFCRLTGYQLYASKNLIYKIKSEFAKGKEDKLVFQVSPHGKIKLLENEYSKRFSKYIDTYLRDDADNFPAFMASVTLELFNLTRKSAMLESTTTDMDITMKPR